MIKTTVLAGFAAIVAASVSGPATAGIHDNSLSQNGIADNGLMDNGILENGTYENGTQTNGVGNAFRNLEVVKLVLPDGSEVTFR